MNRMKELQYIFGSYPKPASRQRRPAFHAALIYIALTQVLVEVGLGVASPGAPDCCRALFISAVETSREMKTSRPSLQAKPSSSLHSSILLPISAATSCCRAALPLGSRSASISCTNGFEPNLHPCPPASSLYLVEYFESTRSFRKT